MSTSAKANLEAHGWRVGSVEEFLELTSEESALIDMRVALAERLRERRKAARRTQADVARAMGSSQARVARMEAADPSVTIDLLVRALLATGDTREGIAQAIGSPV